MKSAAPLLCGLLLTLAGCSTEKLAAPFIEEAQVVKTSRSTELLRSLPPPQEKIAVSVYDFQDQTGQFKPNEHLTDYSRAVTQGGLALLNQALLAAGDKRWFNVVERGGLKNLLQERQIIRMMRDQYATPDGKKLGDLPPMMYAGMLIEGGITGYDSNIVTGGFGARYLGIGANTEYRRDIVTVTLRAVSINTGEVKLSVTTEKTIYSTALSANVFRFVSFDRLLEMESGITYNEPPQFATRQAIEMAVYSLVMEGALDGIWQFADKNAGRAKMVEYLKRTGQMPKQVAAINSKSTAPDAQPSSSRVPAGDFNTPLAKERVKGNAAKLSPKAEKTGIFEDIADFLSFGDDSAPTQRPVDYPTIPLPQKAR